MFSDSLRAILIIGSVLTILFMMWRIRQSKLQIQDSIFWIVFGFVLLVISIFPRLTMWVSNALGFQAPINFVYLVIIFVLLINQFTSSVRISRMDARLQQLAQRQALDAKYQADGHPAPAAAGGPAGNAPENPTDEAPAK